MKFRIHLTALIAMAFLTAASAQVTFGIHAGQLHSWHSQALTYNGQNISFLKGLSVSVSAYKKVNKYLQLGIEPGIAQRGQKNKYPDFFRDNTFFNPSLVLSSVASSFFYTGDVYHTTYIQLPCMAKLQAPLGNGKLGFFIKGGAGIAWLATAYHEMGTFGIEGIGGQIDKVDLKANDHINRMDWGLYGSAGLSVAAGAGHLALSFDSYFGMAQTSDWDGGQNRSIGYSLGYLIDLK